MRIQSINSLYQNKNTFINKKVTNFSNIKNNGDICVLSFGGDKNKVLAENVLNSTDKFNIKTFLTMSPKEHYALKKTTPEPIKKAAKDTIKIASYLKKNLDKKYGENNYIFVGIGTSPACIGRVMEFSGVETKYLPISDLGNLKATKESISTNKKGVDTYKDFLTSQGITKEELNNPKKQIIFYDYTFRGVTLRKYKQFLKDIFDIPTNSLKIEFRSINKDLKQIAEDSFFINKKKVEKYISHYLQYANGSEFGGVPHLNYDELEKIHQKSRSKTTDAAKRFNYFIISELDEKGLLRNNPLNKNCL